MSERLNLLFRARRDNAFELVVTESYSGRTVSGSFVPPYSTKELNATLKKLSVGKCSPDELEEISQMLFERLCDSSIVHPHEAAEDSIRAVFQHVIQRTLDRRGTVALTLSFSPECEELVRYPWELLHDGNHFLVLTGVFTLTRLLLRPDSALRAEASLPVYPPLRILYMSASPRDLDPLDTEASFRVLDNVLADMQERGEVILDSLKQVTFDQLIDYLNTYGGVNDFNDNRMLQPCYVVHFDGHGAFGYLCPNEDCEQFNEAHVRRCACGTLLHQREPQTYLCFCNAQGNAEYISTESLCNVFLNSDVRLAVFSACDTAMFSEEQSRHRRRRRSLVNSTLATGLLKKAQVHAVIAMPFSLLDDLSPTFISHFYTALIDGRTLEEALSRARQAMLSRHHTQHWFVPVLYRYVSKGQEDPVRLLEGPDTPEEHEHLFSELGAPATFVGRERELRELGELLAEAAGVQEVEAELRPRRLRLGTHHIVLTGPAGMGKSALACEAVRQNKERFSGGTIGISLQGGKSFGAAMTEIAHALGLPVQIMHTTDIPTRKRQVLNAFHSLSSRGMGYLLLLDRFNEVQEHKEVGTWYRFLCNLPERVVVLLTSLANPATVAVWEGASCYWHEYRVDKMTSDDLFTLFTELASVSGIDQRIQLYDPKQQKTLQEICTLLDGYPLGAELIFGTAQLIDGKVYQPEAATRSLEEVLEELQKTHLEGIWAVLDVVFRRLSGPARLLLPYLAVFKLPFSHAQITMLVEPGLPAAERAVERLEPEHAHEEHASAEHEAVHPTGASVPSQLLAHWSNARDELVQASFVQFDGRLYSMHAQVRKFALSHLPEDEHRRVLRVAAAYYSSLAHPSPEQWFAAFEHLIEAGEPPDLEKAMHLAISAAQALHGRGHATGLREVLHRAEVYAIRLGEKTCEARIQYWLGTLLRQHGDYAEAIACLMRSFSLHNELNNRDEAAWALHELAMLLREEGDLEQANQRAHEALELFRHAGDAKGEAWMQMALGEVSRSYGRYHEARGHFERALSSFHKLPDTQDRDEGAAFALRDRGIVYEAQSNYEAALEDYEAALRLFTALEMPYWQAWVLVNRSEVYVDQGRYEEAEQACQEAMTIFRQEGGRRGQGWCWRVLGDIARKHRNFGDARNFYDEALSAFNALTDVVDQARVYNSVGAIAFEERAFPVAKEYYEHAQSLAHRQGVRQIEGRALRGVGDVARELHEFDEAQQYYQKSLEIARELDIPSERCAVKRHLGELYTKQSKYPAALEVWMQALSLDQRLGHPERKYLQEKVAALVKDHHLDEEYQKFCKQYGLKDI